MKINFVYRCFLGAGLAMALFLISTPLSKPAQARTILNGCILGAVCLNVGGSDVCSIGYNQSSEVGCICGSINGVGQGNVTSCQDN